MPATKPLEIKFDVNVNGKIVAFTANEIHENTDIPYGRYSTIAPCIGDITITKYPKPLIHDPSKIDQIYMGYKDTIDILQDYVTTRTKQVEHLKCVVAVLDKSIEDKHLFIQCIFFSALLPDADKIKMFAALTDELKQGLEPILGLIAMRKWPFENALKICHPMILSLMNGDFPVEFSMIVGNLKVNDVDLIKQFWRNGGNPNRIHYKLGTILHIAMANEMPSVCNYLIDELEKKQTEPLFDFTIRDWEQKTLLILATKIRAHTVVKKLCELHKRGFDVGLNLHDAQGRTALMLSAVIGDEESFTALIEAGADKTIKDNDGRDLMFYANSPKDVMCETLRSISLEPDRYVGTNHNWLYYNDQLCSPAIYEDSKQQDKMVLISFAPEHVDLVKAVLRDTLKEKNVELFKHYVEQLNVFKDDFTVFAWLNNKVAVKAQTLLDVCLEGQVNIRKQLDSSRQVARVGLRV